MVSFQAIVTSDGTHSFAMFRYGDDMHWTTGTASGGDHVTGLDGTPAQVRIQNIITVHLANNSLLHKKHIILLYT